MFLDIVNFNWMKIMTTRQHDCCLTKNLFATHQAGRIQYELMWSLWVMQLTVVKRDTFSSCTDSLNMSFFTSWDLSLPESTWVFRFFSTLLSFLNPQTHIIAKEEATPPFVPLIINGCYYFSKTTFETKQIYPPWNIVIKHERIKRETRPTSIQLPIIFLQRPKKGGENGHLMTLKCKSRKSLWNRLQPENPVVRGKIILWFPTSIWFTTQRNLSKLAFLQHCTSYWKAER